MSEEGRRELQGDDEYELKETIMDDEEPCERAF